MDEVIADLGTSMARLADFLARGDFLLRNQGPDDADQRLRLTERLGAAMVAKQEAEYRRKTLKKARLLPNESSHITSSGDGDALARKARLVASLEDDPLLSAVHQRWRRVFGISYSPNQAVQERAAEKPRPLLADAPRLRGSDVQTTCSHDSYSACVLACAELPPSKQVACIAECKRLCPH